MSSPPELCTAPKAPSRNPPGLSMIPCIVEQIACIVNGWLAYARVVPQFGISGARFFYGRRCVSLCGAEPDAQHLGLPAAGAQAHLRYGVICLPAARRKSTAVAALAGW